MLKTVCVCYNLIMIKRPQPQAYGIFEELIRIKLSNRRLRVGEILEGLMRFSIKNYGKEISDLEDNYLLAIVSEYKKSMKL